jgi:hypothetical protein
MQTKTVLELSLDEKMEFFSLHNAFKSADTDTERARTSWKFLCFVYKHLGNTMLEYFIDAMFVDNDDMKRITATMIRARAIIQPHLA